MRAQAFVRGTCVAVLVALLAACGARGPDFQASDITGASFGRDFELRDPTGKLRHLAEFRGKAVVVFFGYTQCPDVCPTTLAALADAMKRLGPDADRVQVLFITVDPERDTPQLLAQYVPAFDPRFLGLYGDADATARTAKEFRILYQKVAGSTPGNYTMDHSAGSYVYDPQGRLRLYVANGQGADVFAHDLRALLGSR
jgi:protein SCO1/2